jgi:hypothetical protein
MRTKYKFAYSFVNAAGNKVLVWERRIPGDSRVEQIRCNADWFWSYRPPQRRPVFYKRMKSC